MTVLANFFFASLLAGGMASIISAGPTLAGQVNDQQPSSPQVATQDQQQSPSKPASPRPNPDASGKYHVGDGVAAPELIHSFPPELPEKLREKKISATCLVRLTVDTDGNPTDVHVINSTPSLDDKKRHEAAIEIQDSCIKAVKQYRFEPGIYQGKPVPLELNVKIDFKIF
jgi:TonB family protein